MLASKNPSHGKYSKSNSKSSNIGLEKENLSNNLSKIRQENAKIADKLSKIVPLNKFGPKMGLDGWKRV